jgi:subtilisin-like proprotein convertase family protein
MKRFVLSVLLMLAVVLSAKMRSANLASDDKHFGGTPPPHTLQHAPRRALDDIFSSGPIHLPIPDLDSVSHTLTITSGQTIDDCNIYLKITHSWIRDLRVTVTHVGSSASDTVTLINTFPGDSIRDIDVWFDSDADSSILHGIVAVPIDSTEDSTDFYQTLAGTWRPLASLDSLNGVSADGEWILKVVDRFALDTGFVEEWAIEINRARALRGTATRLDNGLPIPSVKVETIPATATVFTNSSGSYGFDLIADGTYDLRFSKQFYDTVLFSDLIVSAATPIEVNAQMRSLAIEYDYSSSSAPVRIPDGRPDNGATMALSIPDVFAIGDLNVTVNVTHTFVGDLALSLTNPNAVSVSLVTVGSQCPPIGADLLNCTFDDEATDLYLEGTGSHTGSYRPAVALSRFDGQFSSGEWILSVSDYCDIDSGTIDSYSLHIVELLDANEPPRAPREFELLAAYPNPFNSTVNFEFTLHEPTTVALEIFDLNGRLAATVADADLAAGIHHFYFSAEHLASGVYFAKLQTPSQSITRKIILLK